MQGPERLYAKFYVRVWLSKKGAQGFLSLNLLQCTNATGAGIVAVIKPQLLARSLYTIWFNIHCWFRWRARSLYIINISKVRIQEEVWLSFLPKTKLVRLEVELEAFGSSRLSAHSRISNEAQGSDWTVELEEEEADTWVHMAMPWDDKWEARKVH